jgi:hypothetical protein
MKIDHFIELGTQLWYEYHCYEGHDSCDANLWYHSHQKVIVGECTNADKFGELTLQERQEDGTPLVYNVTFADGLKGQAFEDELLKSKSFFIRPDPPRS